MAEAEDQPETSQAAGGHRYQHHQEDHLILLSTEQEESSRGEEFDQEEEQGERIWVREDKVYPSLQRYLACRSCENCNRDVELVDMMILKHGNKIPLSGINNTNMNNSTPPPAESGSTCSDHSDPTEHMKSKLLSEQSNLQLQLVAPPPVPSPRVDLPARSTQLVRSSLPPPPPPDQHVCCVFCGSETRFEHYNNHKLDQPRYRCIKCKQRFTNGGKLRNKRLKLCASNTNATSLNESCEPT